MESNKEKRREAAALKYTPENNSAPVIVALGKGETADKIIETAKEHDVPLHKDPKLANTLNKMKTGDVIPPDLYEVVAEIFAFVYKMDKSYGEKNETFNK